MRCDLLENSYLCGISNNDAMRKDVPQSVVICLKIRTFVVSATTGLFWQIRPNTLWFAWKFVPLWYQQQHHQRNLLRLQVVICLKIRTFVVSATTCLSLSNWTFGLWFAWKFVPLWYQQQQWLIQRIKATSCDLLENSYLCGISNNSVINLSKWKPVVICLKIRTFVVSATTGNIYPYCQRSLWFAWKFVPLWYQQQRYQSI